MTPRRSASVLTSSLLVLRSRIKAAAKLPRTKIWGSPEKSSKKKNRLITDQAVFSVQRRGLEPPSQLRRQHLKLVCLPVPPPLRSVVTVRGKPREVLKGPGVYQTGGGGCKPSASESVDREISGNFGGVPGAQDGA